MNKRADETLLGEIHTAIAQELLRRIRLGTASAADLNVARQFLKDNGIDAIPNESTPLGVLAQLLPTFDDDNEDEYPIRPN